MASTACASARVSFNASPAVRPLKIGDGSRTERTGLVIYLDLRTARDGRQALWVTKNRAQGAVA